MSTRIEGAGSALFRCVTLEVSASPSVVVVRVMCRQPIRLSIRSHRRCRAACDSMVPWRRHFVHGTMTSADFALRRWERWFPRGIRLTICSNLPEPRSEAPDGGSSASPQRRTDRLHRNDRPFHCVPGRSRVAQPRSRPIRRIGASMNKTVTRTGSETIAAASATVRESGRFACGFFLQPRPVRDTGYRSHPRCRCCSSLRRTIGL